MRSIIGLAIAVFPAALAAQINVDVGPNGNLTYSPESITAAIGDVINFTFHPKNHTVTQSSFDEPCVPLAGGFNSGFKPVASDADTVTYPVTVASTDPIWIYCQQIGHCGKGMVFAVNPPQNDPTHSFQAFQALAIQLNGTATSSSASSSSSSTAASTSSFVTPPAPTWATATATIVEPSTTIVTTYSSYDGTPSPTEAPTPQNHKIIVGANGQLVYSPANITALIGDTVTFEFHPKNHTVTQSSFLQPCRPLADTSTTGQVGFFSGFQPVATNATDFPTFTITVNDTAPIWGYCSQTGHCGQGMVFSINAVESGPNNFAAFQALAEHINGTSTSATSTAPSSSTATSSASATHSNAATVATGSQVGYYGVLAMFGVVAGFL